MKKFTPVIHVHTLEQTIKNIDICINANVYGVFLINHRINFKKFNEIIKSVREKYPNLWIGVNVLGDQDFGESPSLVLPSLPEIQGYWIDNPRLIEGQETQDLTVSLKDTLKFHHPKALLFGGVAFKYQVQPNNLEEMTSLATNYIDIITTTGDRTGSPADVIKIRRMYKASNGHPMAIASGIDINNVKEYLPLIDWFLVATQISYDHENLNPTLVSQMSEIISKWNYPLTRNTCL